MSQQTRILVADDDAGVLDLLRQMFELEGFHVFPAQDGTEAVEIARSTPLDVAVLDLQMPVMGGIEALKAIKALDPTIEVIVVTGHAGVDSLNEILSRGAYDYIPKPFHRVEIVHTVKNARNKRHFSIENNRMKMELESRIVQIQRDFEERTLRLRESQIKYRQIIEHSSDGIVIAQDWLLRFVNPKFAQITGFPEGELVNAPFLDFIHPEDRAMVEERYRMRLDGGEAPATYALRLLRKDGEPAWVEISAVRTDWEGRPATLSFLRDIHHRKLAEDKLVYMGTHDALTGLYNRGRFEEEMARLERGRRYPIGIMVADVDRLKAVNDSAGHAAGDRLLQRAAEVLLKSCRADDLVARIGGDEFAVLLPDTDAEGVNRVLSRVRNQLVRDRSAEEGVSLEMSLGAAVGERGCSLMHLLREADTLMYRDKVQRAGNGTAQQN